jgi:hypothetical protein
MERNIRVRSTLAKLRLPTGATLWGHIRYKSDPNAGEPQTHDPQFLLGKHDAR